MKVADWTIYQGISCERASHDIGHPSIVPWFADHQCMSLEGHDEAIAYSATAARENEILWEGTS